jgi:hypothetical protein
MLHQAVVRDVKVSIAAVATRGYANESIRSLGMLPSKENGLDSQHDCDDSMNLGDYSRNKISLLLGRPGCVLLETNVILPDPTVFLVVGVGGFEQHNKKNATGQEGGVEQSDLSVVEGIFVVHL